MRNFKLVVIIFGSLFLYAVGAVLSILQLHFMAATLISIAIGAHLYSRLSLTAIDCRPGAIIVGHAGEMVSYFVTLTNRSQMPRFMVEFIPQAPEWAEPVDLEASAIPVLWAGETRIIELRYRLTRRGFARVTVHYVATSDPLGIFAAKLPVHAPVEITSYPTPFPLKVESIGLAIAALENSAARTSPVREGTDFHGIREYRRGDDLRHIHWKSTAHHGAFNVIEFDEPTASTLVCFIDNQRRLERGSGAETTLEYLVQLAVSLLDAFDRQGTRCLLIDNDTDPLVLQVHTSDFAADLDRLARLQQDSLHSLLDTVRRWRLQLAAESATIVCATSESPDLPQAVAALTAQRFAVFCFVLDAQSFSSVPIDAPDGKAVTDAVRRAGASAVSIRRGESLKEAAGWLLD